MIVSESLLLQGVSERGWSVLALFAATAGAQGAHMYIYIFIFYYLLKYTYIYICYLYCIT